ncbi:hypothetical protein [Streptomyces sp. SID14478]|uniref:hypothetical protein n=1 Tax=Streptomyces sp. SID14478 TaxID=2706073 RepID=UPI001943C497|nr:hypothetical protein [Streptomyces sp. SID14478]
MESQKVTPVTGAGFDPAYVPGLTSPGPEAPAKDVEDVEDVEDTVTESESDAVAEEVTTQDEPEKAVLEKSADPEADPEAEAEGEKDSGDGPVLEAKDRRGSITVDATGVRFTLDDQEADFTWDEISAVEYGTSRKRLTVTVHMPNSRWFPNDVEAPDKARLAEWTDRIDEALDAYFEE